MDTLKFSAEKTLSCINQKWCTLFPYTYLSFSDSSGKNGNFSKNVTVTTNLGQSILFIKGNIITEAAKPKSPVQIGD